MKKEQLVKSIIENKVIAIIRTSKDEQIPEIINALLKGGIRFIEVTANTANAVQWLKTMSSQGIKDLVIGAGTVTNALTAKKCIEAGAEFLVTPFTRKEIIAEAHRMDVPVISGAMTPGEIAGAHELGADLVKVFPAEMFGPRYIKAIKAPLDYIKLAPTGGINQENAGQWIKAGADALGVRSALFTSKMLEEKQYDLIYENARSLMEAIKTSKEAL